jgi:hypothetical protein
MKETKKTYQSIKEYGQDMSYENEVRYKSREDRGGLDFTYRVDQLIKQKEFLQDKCRQAGQTIEGLKKELDRLSEENDNLRTMLGDRNVKG